MEYTEQFLSTDLEYYEALVYLRPIYGQHPRRVGPTPAQGPERVLSSLIIVTPQDSTTQGVWLTDGDCSQELAREERLR